MALQDTINDLERQRTKLTDALTALYELKEDQQPSRSYNPPSYHAVPPPTPTKKSRNISPQVSADRSLKMREAWARRRQAAQSIPTTAPTYSPVEENPFAKELEAALASTPAQTEEPIAPTQDEPIPVVENALDVEVYVPHSKPSKKKMVN